MRPRRHQEGYDNSSDEGGTIKQTDDSNSLTLQSDLDSNICEHWGQEHYHKSLQFWAKKSADLSLKCHVLEQEAKERDIEERHSRERIQSLENQLERLLVQKGTPETTASLSFPPSTSTSLLTGCDSREFNQDESKLVISASLD